VSYRMNTGHSRPLPACRQVKKVGELQNEHKTLPTPAGLPAGEEGWGLGS
jgi:hypothetical protein